MRAAKKRGLPDEEVGLYDEDELDALDIPAEDVAEHSNGDTPKEAGELEYLETKDEDELRTLISNIEDTVEVLLPVPEWKVNGKIVTVLIRTMDTFQRTTFMNEMKKVDWNMTKLYPDLVILSARHPITKRLIFRKEDRRMLLTKLGKAMERIALKASDINGMSQEALDDMRKN
jgi:hypothetical protein